jgi:ABC-type Na+ efflux pump permease subunit
MFVGVLALLERSLRVDARAWGPHLARLGLMAAIYIAVCYASVFSARFGAPGLRFFNSIAYLNLIFMSLLGISFFSTSITEEKEEDTLGLMLMAGISPLGILLGKSGGRLIQALLLVAVQYPFTLLAVTMGGVTQDQVRSTYVGMLAYLVMLAGVGLLCSTLSTRNRSASIRLILLLAAYCFIPFLCKQLLATGGVTPFYRDAMQFVTDTSVFLQMGTILSSGFRETLWSTQVVTNLSLGVLGFVFSWIFFGQASREPATEAASRGLVTRSRGPFRLFAPGRPWVLPIPWKDFHFVSGGVVSIGIRLVVCGLLWLFAEFMVTGMFGPGIGLNVAKQTHSVFLVLMMFAVSIDAGMVVSRSLSDEIRSQTLATLLLLPTSTGQILYGKIAGSLLGWLPGALCLFFAMTLFKYGREVTYEFFREGGVAVWMVAHLLLVPHATAAIAMFVRWGALPLGIGTAIGSLFLSVSIFEALRVNQNAAIVWVVAFVVLGVCAFCHVVVWLKAEAICAR